jgi:lysozyme
MSGFSTKVSLALWQRRLAYREKRHAHWHRKHNARNAAKWHHLVEEAQVMIATRKAQLEAEAKPVPAKGLDVSNLQGSIDWRKVKDAGYRFVFVKAGEGDWLDPKFLDNVIEARKAGLKIGAYQFLRPKAGRHGNEEAQYFIDALRTAALGKGDLRPVLDVEATALDRAGTHAYVKTFVNAMHAHGFKPMIYTAKWFWEPHVSTSEDFGLPLWVAGYVPESQLVLPKPWKQYAVWQWTDKATVPGIQGHVDANRTPDLRKLIA